MMILNYNSFEAILDSCSKHDNFYAAIILWDESTKKLFMDCLKECEDNGDYEFTVALNDEVRFSNGSIIKVLSRETMIQSGVGRRFHQILTDFAPTNDEVSYLKTLTVPFRPRKNKKNEIINSEESEITDSECLDKFLKEFKIVRKEDY